MKPLVSIVKAVPEDILEAYFEALKLANCSIRSSDNCVNYIVPEINWRRFLPGCGTMPWHLEGAILNILSQQHSYKSIKVLYNPTVDTLARSAYKHDAIMSRYGLLAESLPHHLKHLTEKQKDKATQQDNDHNYFFLSSCRCHVIYQLAGALWGLFKTLQQTTDEQKETDFLKQGFQLFRNAKHALGNGIYLMDLTTAGEGPGPFCLRPRYPGYIMASRDPIALDTVLSLLIGLDPLQTPMLKLAHDLKQGPTQLKDLEVVGEKLRDVEPYFSSWVIPIPGGLVAKMEKYALNSPHSLRGYFSRWVRENLWFPLRGNRRAQTFLHNDWGFLWQCF